MDTRDAKTFVIAVLYDAEQKRQGSRYAVVEVEDTAAGTYMTTINQVAKLFKDYKEAQHEVMALLFDLPPWVEEFRFIPRQMLLDNRAIAWSRPCEPEYESYPEINENWALWEMDQESEIG